MCNSSRVLPELTWKPSKALSQHSPWQLTLTPKFSFLRSRHWRETVRGWCLSSWYHVSQLTERPAEDKISTRRQALSARGQEKQHISEQWCLVSAWFVWLGIHLFCSIHLQPLTSLSHISEQTSSVWAIWGIIMLSPSPLLRLQRDKTLERQEVWPSGTLHWAAGGLLGAGPAETAG